MNSKRLLALIAVFLLMIPAMALAGVPDPKDSIIVEQKVAAPVAGACNSAPLKVRVYITNKDSLGNVTLPFLTTSISGGAYSIVSRPANCSASRTSPVVFDFLYPVAAGSGTPRLATRIPSFAGYHSNSPDTFMGTFTFQDPTDDDTKLPPNLTRTVLLDIKFDSCSNLGVMDIDSGKVLASTIQFVDTKGTTQFINFVKGSVTQSLPPANITNCAGANQNVLYGRPFSYTFTADLPVTWSTSGPGVIDASGKYDFAGACPLGPIPVTVTACLVAAANVCTPCNFTLTIVDGAPTCSVAPPSVSGNVGAPLAATVTGSDPDAGDFTTLSKLSGIGAFNPATGAWTFTGGCADVGTHIVVFQAVDGFPACPAGHFSDVCSLTVTISNSAPSVTCPPSGTAQAGVPYTATATASDPGGPAPLTFSICGVSPAPTNPVTIDPVTGEIDWLPDAADANKCFDICVEVSDGCTPPPGGEVAASSRCTYQLCVVSGEKFRLCIDVVEFPRIKFQGGDVLVYINNLVEAFDPDCDTANGGSGAVGGFSFLLSYDCSCLQFISAAKGSLLAIQRWEFFTYRFGALGNGNCGSGCPSCLIRIVAIADINNSNIHPTPCDERDNKGQWVCLKFRTSSDLRLAGLCCPINWYWLDCNDNTISDCTGNCLWIACSLYTPEGGNIDLATAFPTVNVADCKNHSGGPGKPSPKPWIIFCNGKICLPPLESLDDRGDINLNGLANEIADAVLFENYFIYGPSVFIVNIPGQSAASDINGDGRPLTIADLVALIRIITGDANPLPKAIPGAVVNLAMDANLSEVNLSANSASELGGLYLKFKVNGTVGTPVLSEAAAGMTMKTNLVGDELSVLIFTDENHRGTSIAPNAGKLLTIPVTGSVDLVEADAANYLGASVPVLAKATPVPSKFSLSQNFPNPFNPKTSFVLALPVASEYSVTVYNIAGQVVKTFAGSASAGNKIITWDGTDNNGAVVSSGIYFYKAIADKYSDTKRMMFLK